MHQAFKICHINTRSLVKNFSKLKEVAYNKYDIITISESWLNEGILDETVALSGYKLFRQDRLGRGGGVAVYIKHTIKASPIPYMKANLTEQLWLSIVFKNKKIALGTLYSPHVSHYEMFLNEFENLLSVAVPTFDYILCAGDLNIDVLDSLGKECIMLNNVISSFGLKQVIDQPTRISPTSMKLLDVIICQKI